MKRFCISLFLIIIIIVTVAVGLKTTPTSENYLRIHIRANSNSSVDQEVKYLIKDELISFLTPYVAECKSKDEAVTLLNNSKKTMEDITNKVLSKNGFTYTSNVVVRNELFPTRVYEDFTLNAGFYDAVIVGLGEAKGDNWWCVVYPPLCFTGSTCGVKYKSKLLEIIKKFYS